MLIPVIISIIFLPCYWCLDEIDSTFRTCCNLGTKWGTEKLQCSKNYPMPIPNINIEQQSICLSSIELCCIQTIRKRHCEDGIALAKRSAVCFEQGPGSENIKYCCEACKLGIIYGSVSNFCKSFDFGSLWTPVFESCCSSIISPSLPTVAPNLNNKVDLKPESGFNSISQTQDICELLPGELCQHICVPVPGSYRCECRPGFSLLGDGKSCHQDIASSRCKANNPCAQRCSDNGSSIKCFCNTGYQLKANGHSCEDINECALGIDTCDKTKEWCKNELGSFSCIAIKTEVTNKSANASSLINDNYSARSNAPAIPSKAIHCPLGFKINYQQNGCSDIDECKEGLHVCNEATEACINIPGGYRCSLSKVLPTTVTSKNTSPKNFVSCGAGFIYDSVSNKCADFDECSTDPCDSNQECENTVGSYRCLCKKGFKMDNITLACVDINECQTKLHDCQVNTRCDNTIGSFQCIRFTSCGTGYTLNVETGLCEDDDECSLKTDNCRFLGPSWQCRNTHGSFRCEKRQCTFNEAQGECSKSVFECPVGYEVNRNNRCLDINECTKQKDICDQDQQCINLPGSYKCMCKPGFQLSPNGRSCIDINECSLFGDRNICIGQCENTPGSYKCSCPPGYILGNNNASCRDIDECLDANRCLAADEVCFNIQGSFQCKTITCPTGYSKDRDRKNRCNRLPQSCPDFSCAHKPIAYTYDFITLVSNLPIPPIGHQELLSSQATMSDSTSMDFKLNVTNVYAAPGIPKADLSFFRLNRIRSNQALLLLTKPIKGPQEIFLELVMEFYKFNALVGSSVSKISVIVSQYEF